MDGLHGGTRSALPASLTTSHNDRHRDEPDDHERADAFDDPRQHRAGRRFRGGTVLALDDPALEVREGDGVLLLPLDLSALALGHLPGERGGIEQLQLRGRRLASVHAAGVDGVLVVLVPDRPVGLRNLPLRRDGADSFVLPVNECRLSVGKDVRFHEEVVQRAAVLSDGRNQAVVRLIGDDEGRLKGVIALDGDFHVDGDDELIVLSKERHRVTRRGGHGHSGDESENGQRSQYGVDSPDNNGTAHGATLVVASVPRRLFERQYYSP